MIHIAETIAIQSIEQFLAADEVDIVRTAMAEITAAQGVAPFDTDRQNTMHAIPGLDSTEVMAVYEPNGRLEITDLPEAVTVTLEAALKRAMPAINRIMPSITRCHPWVYVEYRPGQFITPHVDNIAPEPSAWPRQVAGIGVLIEPAVVGGEFYVETTGDDRLWAEPPVGIPGYAAGMAIAREGSDYSSADFRSMARTRWNVTPSVGTALLYGSQLTHGTEPVVAGVCRKFINWLVCDEPH